MRPTDIGIHENVEVTGRVFHVQTEVTAGDEPTIRTSVFFGGQLIGSRSRPVEPDVGIEDLEARVRAQQEQIIDNFVSRAAALAADGPAPGTTKGEGAARPASAKAAAPPDPEADPRLAESLAVRGLISRFRNPLPDTDPGSDEDLEASLKKAGRGIRRAIDDPAFVDVRLDEQVAFYDLKGRIAGVLEGAWDPGVARELWTELKRFSLYLGRINHRRELIAYDQRLLTWALAAIGGRGPDDEILGHLAHARGRSRDFDRLLDHPEDIGADQWMDAVMQLIDQTV